ncbi:MAG: TolC family protein [Flammeovirgaceae bacterium]|nr:TolC family protein [Flammeovirgaceae bacterium]
MRTLLIKLLFITSMSAFAQSTLDSYIDEGLKNNAVLQQKDISLERALLSLRIANNQFLPSVNLQGSYTHGEGGRNIAIPIGDLLNPIYENIGSPVRVENVEQTFFPQNFYDARVRTTMPILNSDLIYNRKIKNEQVLLQQYEVEIYTRELIRNIKVAYYNYLSASEAIRIYQNALTRAQEGMRVNESLLANGKGLPAYVLRSQSEIESIKAQITHAEKQVHQAQLYFNFLLNRSMDEPVAADTLLDKTVLTSASTGEINYQSREELKQVQQSITVQQHVEKMNKLFWSPRLSAFADVGSQAQDWHFNDQSRYVLLGVQLDIPLFAGFTNRAKINQSKLDVKYSELNYSNVTRQLQMSSSVAKDNLNSAYQNYQSAQKQLEAARSYQKLIDKGYKEGVNTFIEAIDARNQLTNAQFQLTINQFRVLTAEANYERETAAYQLN